MGYISHCNTRLDSAGGESVWRPARDLHTDAARRRPPQAVMVCPVFQGRLVWVRHAERGWELPGGKVEPGESPEAAARRECLEEAGLQLGPLVWLAEYVYDLPHREGQSPDSAVKWVYAASVEDAGARTAESETVDVRVFRPVPSPEDVRQWPEASPILKDDVYPLIWRLMRERGWLVD
jgi:8-oxo-dGTP diphosphatase